MPDPLEAVEPGRTDWFESVELFLEAWAAIEKNGVDGFLRMHGDGESELDPVFVDAFEWFTSELARLEHEVRVEEAAEQRRRLARKR